MNSTRISLLVITFLILAIVSCKEKTTKEMLLGEWKFHSSIDLKTNKTIKKGEENKPLYALINKDFIILTTKKNNEKDEKYTWKLKADTIELIKSTSKDTFLIYLKFINEERLEIEMDFFGKLCVKFEKV